MNTLADVARTGAPLVIAYGLGVDSTAVLVGLAARGIRPDKILFADTGSEKPETYAYLAVINQWLRERGFPEVEVVRYVPKRAPYTTLEGNCLANDTLPSLAYGGKSCSLKWKREPQDRHVRRWQPARDAWARGQKVYKAIGYDAGPADSRRFTRGERRGDGKVWQDGEYRYLYPLREWGWDREECKRQIAAAGLPVPVKSACFFCPASKPDEIAALSSDMQARIVEIERRAARRAQCGVCTVCGKLNCSKHKGCRCGKLHDEHLGALDHAFEAGVAGLWRSGTSTRPGSMTVFLRTLQSAPQGACEGDCDELDELDDEAAE